ncbi:MAG: exo 1,3/1,4-beta-D-glucan glucohydrolase [Wenzhouxiangellaceae bacterium]|nr:exo 1,3/1,4-beta-D-glucan glucohydrolase [Wenzhouxiangellaceae bacterium]
MTRHETARASDPGRRRRASQAIPAVALAIVMTLAGPAVAGPGPDPAWGGRIEHPSDPALERRLDELLAQMSLEQKIGQIIQAEIQHVTPEDVRRYGLGSILNGGGSFPGLDRQASIQRWTALAAAFHEAAREPMRDGLPAIPLLWGTDAVHGHNNVFGATVFPHNIGLGATRNAELVQAIARATAGDVAATGIDWTFAPTLAVSRDPRWGRAYESFSSDPGLVAALGRAAVLGLQGEPGRGWLGASRVLATAKHFVGDGGTFRGIDQGDTRLSETELAAIHGLPYRAALDAGVQTVMASFSSWDGRKMHGHRHLLTDVLKNTLGFDGFVIGDWNGHGQVPGCTVTDCLQALEAGIDMFMVPEDWLQFRNTLLEHARAGRLPKERLDDAVRRILRVKHRAGLFDEAVGAGRGRGRLESHGALARRAVRESLVLLKNNDRVLPLDPRRRIAVVGDGVDDIGKQSGGWTLDWQGVTGANDSFPNGQSIHDGIAEQVAAASGRTHLGEAGIAEFGPDAVIAVIGENPYAEGQGDRETLEFEAGSRTGLDLLDRLGALEVPVVTVFLSGRPLWVNPELNRSDAFVAAWLPGTEGGGVADVILAGREGRVQHQPSGRLPFAWPAAPEPDADGEFPTLFGFGFGLSYADDIHLGRLPEAGMAPRAAGPAEAAGTIVFDGRARAPWRLVLREADGGSSIDAGAQIARTSGPDPVVITPTDRHVQGDARRVEWTGASGDEVLLVRDEALDLTALHENGAMLTFELRPESTTPFPVRLSLECGESCTAEIPLAGLLRDDDTGQWRRIRLPLSCFKARGADLTGVTSVFSLSSAQPAELSFADVRIEAADGAAAPVSDCPE